MKKPMSEPPQRLQLPPRPFFDGRSMRWQIYNPIRHVSIAMLFLSYLALTTAIMFSLLGDGTFVFLIPVALVVSSIGATCGLAAVALREW